MRSPQTLLFSRIEQPQVSHPGFICSSYLIIFVTLLWTQANRSLSFLCWGPQRWMQHSRWGLTRTEPLSTFWPECSPDGGWKGQPAGLWVHIVGSCPVFHPLEPPSPSLQDWSQWILFSNILMPRPRYRTLHLAFFFCLVFLQNPVFLFFFIFYLFLAVFFFFLVELKILSGSSDTHAKQFHSGKWNQYYLWDLKESSRHTSLFASGVPL